MESSTKVIVNTGISYLKIGVTMIVGLFTTRFALDALGVGDYGLYNLVAGVVTLLAFLNSAMTTSTQRYLSYNQGQKRPELQIQIFQTSVILHLIIGVGIFVIMEVASLFLFDGFLNIPQERTVTIKVIYQFLVASIFFTVVSTPYTASINAHEEIYWIALVNVLEVVIKLAIALSIYHIDGDRLLMYGTLMPALSFFIFLFYFVIGTRRYRECTLTGVFKLETSRLKEMGSYASWNLFGTLASLGRTQGLAVLLNIFFGIFINAAYAICMQLNQKVRFLSGALVQVINPQIMKSEGAGNRDRMLKLSLMASKFGFFLVALVSIPLIFEMEAVIGIWLKNVPEHSVIFCQLALIATLVNQLTVGLQSALQAIGRIKTYQSVVGGLILLNLPIAYLLLDTGQSPHSVLISFIVIEALASCIRLIFVNRIAGLSYYDYLNKVVFCQIIPLLSSIIVCGLIINYYTFYYRFIVTGFSSVLVFGLMAFFFSLQYDERNVVNQFLFKLIRKVQKPRS